MEWKAVRYEAGDGIGLITLNRPHRSNAWTGRMAFEYRTAMQLAEGDDRVGAIVVTGEGRHFCVGADTRALDRFAESGQYESGVREPLPEPGDPEHPAHGTVFGFPLAVAKPVIAAVNGAVAGVGFVLACFTDVRFSAAGAKWTPSGSRLGLPAEHGDLVDPPPADRVRPGGGVALLQPGRALRGGAHDGTGPRGPPAGGGPGSDARLRPPPGRRGGALVAAHHQAPALAATCSGRWPSRPRSPPVSSRR